MPANHNPLLYSMKCAEFTHSLKDVTINRDFFELSKLFGVPKSKFSTWNTRGHTCPELMARSSQAFKVPLELFVFKPSEQDIKAIGKASVVVEGF